MKFKFITTRFQSIYPITNESGEILHTTDTLAYGEELTSPYEDDNDKVLNTITYTGHEKDYETNLTYMLARYYSQGYGRFLSPDPGYDYDQLDPMSWNLYSYVRGNPVKNVDKTGKFTDISMHAAVYQDDMDAIMQKAESSPKPELSPEAKMVEGFFQFVGGIITGAIIVSVGASLAGMVAEAGAATILNKAAGEAAAIGQFVEQRVLETGIGVMAEKTVEGVLSGKNGGEIAKEQVEAVTEVVVSGGNSKVGAIISGGVNILTSKNKIKAFSEIGIERGFKLITESTGSKKVDFVLDVVEGAGQNYIIDSIFGQTNEDLPEPKNNK